MNKKTAEIRLVNKKLEAIIAYDKEKPAGLTIAEYYQEMEQTIRDVKL